LIRATNGLPKPHRTDSRLRKSKPKIKLSTIVEAGDLGTFYEKYADVCKKGMEGLRKRDRRKGRKKGKGRG
jgi:signal recognition particle subunit SRP14